MAGRGDVGDSGGRSAQRSDDVAQPETVAESQSRLLPPTGSERDDPSETSGRENGFGKGVIRVPGQARVLDPLDRTVYGESFGETHGCAVLPLDPQRKSLQPPQQKERLVRCERSTQIRTQGTHGIQVLTLADDDPARSIAVPTDVLGGGVHHQIRAH